MYLQNKIRIGGHGKSYAEITESSFSIQKIFSGYRFRFNFTIRPFDKENENPVVLQVLDIDLSYRDSKTSNLLGRMIEDLAQEPHKLAGHEFSMTKYFDIRADDFLRLIDNSHRSDMVFEFQAKPIFSNTKEQSRSETGSLKVPQSDWIQEINRTELDRFELIAIRIPIASSHLHTPFVEALKKIREAEQQYIRGDWNGAASSCRAAWRTILSATPAGAKPIEHLLATVSGDPRQKEFVTELIKGLHNIQNKAVHLEGDVKTGTPAADISPETALLCIHWYSAIIAYLSSVV